MTLIGVIALVVWLLTMPGLVERAVHSQPVVVFGVVGLIALVVFLAAWSGALSRLVGSGRRAAE